MPQQVALVERIGHFLYFKTFALVGNPNCELAFARPGNYVNSLVSVIAVSVHNRIDHAFSHGHADAMLFVLVEADIPGGLKDFLLGAIDAFEGGRILSVEQNFRAGSHSSVFAASRKSVHKSKGYHKMSAALMSRPRRKVLPDTGACTKVPWVQ